MAERVCEAFRSSPASLRETFNARDDLPDISAVYRWEEQYPEFHEQLQRARAARAHILAETALEIADATEFDTVTKQARNGEEFETPNHEWINRSRLRFEARRWLAKTMNQRAYGDRSEQTGSVEVRHVIHVGPPPK